MGKKGDFPPPDGCYPLHKGEDAKTMNRITKSKEMPVYLFHQGTNAHAWELLGAHRQLNGKTNFCTWAPHAAAISVVGDFNGWDAAANPMTRLNEQGLWGDTVELTHD